MNRYHSTSKEGSDQCTSVLRGKSKSSEAVQLYCEHRKDPVLWPLGAKDRIYDYFDRDITREFSNKKEG